MKWLKIEKGRYVNMENVISVTAIYEPPHFLNSDCVFQGRVYIRFNLEKGDYYERYFRNEEDCRRALSQLEEMLDPILLSEEDISA